MKPVRDVVSRDVVEDLWGAGYTILPRVRHPDPFHVPPELVPVGKAYQWWHLVHDKVHFVGKWNAVDASRHDGYYMPAGHVGNIEVQGLGLFEKSKDAVDAHHAEVARKAHQNVEDWIRKTGAEFSGEITTGGVTAEVGDPALAAIINPKTKTIDTRVKLPADMFPYMTEVFAERDRLYEALITAWNGGMVLTDEEDAIRKRYEEALAEDPEILKGPTLNALWLPIAIENVRKSLVTPYQPPKE